MVEGTSARKAGRLPTFFKAWRKFRGLTQQRLADRIEMTKTRVSLKERGEEPYDQDYLEALAQALDTDVASLLTRDPEEEADLHAMLNCLPPEVRERAVEVVRALKIAHERPQLPESPITATVTKTSAKQRR